MIVVGVDGGATSTKALALDTSARRVAIATSGPSNPVNNEPELSGRNIRAAVEKALEGLGLGISELDLVFAGLAGFDSSLVKARLEPLVKQSSGLGDKLALDHDAYISLLSATRGEPGVLVIAGTGSIAMGYDGERRVVLGDRGWLLGDEGSGFWVARLALRRLRRALDGLAPHDCLTRNLSMALGTRSSDELMYWFYLNKGIDRIARVVIHVSEAANKGCEAAQELLARGARLLAAIASRVATIISVDTVYGVGSLFKSRLYRQSFAKELRRRIGAKLVVGTVYPVIGALYEALRLLGYRDAARIFTDEAVLSAASRLYS